MPKFRPNRQTFARRRGSSAWLAAALAACAFAPALSAQTFSSSVAWTWSGGVSSSGGTVSSKLTATNSSVQLVVSPNSDLSSPVFVSGTLTTDASGRVRATASGLSAATRYWYGFRIGGTDHLAGRLATLPAAGAASYTFGVGACADWADANTFDAIKSRDPWFFLFTGDFFYNNIGDNNPVTFRSAYDTALGLKQGKSLTRWMPVGYVWDDHDYGPDGSNANNPSKTAAHSVYRQLVPHWPMGLSGAGDASSTTAIAQSFVAGRVRFALADCRTDNRAEIDGTRLISDAQRDWLAQEATAAANAGQLFVWISSVPWNGAAASGTTDAWAGAPTQRTALADALKDTGANIVILAGDAHMSAIDDGTNTDFATGGGMPMPVFQAAPLWRQSSFKGGPYNKGVSRREVDGDKTWGDDKSAQFGLVNVSDDGNSLGLTFSAKWGGDSVGSTTVNATHGSTGAALNQAGAAVTWSLSIPTVSVSAAASSVNEGSSVTLSVTRGGSTTSALTVALAASGTATAADYSLGATSVTIPAGASSATTTLSATTDSVADAGEAVQVKVAPKRGYLVGGNPASIGINDQASGPNPPAADVNARPLYEAESAALSGPTSESANAGYSGAGYADYGANAGEYVEFAVAVPLAGDYDLLVRYANGGSTNRPLQISVNGASVATPAFAATGSWTTWSTVTQRVTLPAGASTVRLTSTGAGPNVDLLRVAYPFAARADLPEVTSLPDPFVLANGTRLAAAADWSKQRHHLKEMLQHYLYGQLPPEPRSISYSTVSGSTKAYTTAAGTAATEHVARISFDGFSFDTHVYKPNTGRTTWPVVVMLSWTLDPQNDAGYVDNFTTYNLNKLLDRGYAVANLVCTDLAIDEGTGAGDRSLGLFAKYPAYDFGAVGAWAHGIRRVVDYVSTLSWVDTSKIAATGWSRLGKAALCAAAYDTRIALVNPNGSGLGGAGSFRIRGDKTGGNPGGVERIQNLTTNYPHWFNSAFATFAGYETRLPFDMHAALALLAPRAVLSTDALDDTWANPYGTQMNFWAAREVFTWLGSAEQSGAHWRSGGHGQIVEDIEALLDFAGLSFYGITPTQALDNVPVPSAAVLFPWRAPDGDNLAANAGLEAATLSPWGGGGSWGTFSRDTATPRTGSAVLRLERPAGCHQIVTGLTANTSYQLSAWLRTEAADGRLYLGVKNHGATEVNAYTSGTGYRQVVVPFTTGPSATSAEIYLWRDTTGTGAAWADDVRVSR